MWWRPDWGTLSRRWPRGVRACDPRSGRGGRRRVCPLDCGVWHRWR